jgi:hypothetical protein
MKIRLLDTALQDLMEGSDFYERQEKDLGAYFFDSLFSDIDSLLIYAGIHSIFFKAYYRLLSKRFPFAIYYRVPEAWTEYVDTPLTDVEIEKVRTSVNRQSPFGSVEWQQQTIARLGLESTVRRRGRPWDSDVK